ncbi:MAG: DNA polymerase III subunit gamma/tau [Halanaerobiales bacterium]|nr:DNA polymerase III subunit gamma/tau [Halanaerobiales bacterium]
MQPLSLKYRPQNFNDFVGNEANAKIIKKAIQKNKLSVSLLFSGRRGTGKTSLARVVAKSLNCPNQKDGEPCNECQTCKAIDRSSFIDVVEIDGASKSKVKHMRQLSKETIFAPSTGKTKIYIIDECHNINKKAWNALLKPIEEAKDNIRFIFCTTEHHSVPGTIKSRLNLYRFKEISKQNIYKRLKYISKQEDFNINDDSLKVIASKSRNSMRDAINLLEQYMVAEGNSDLQKQLLREISSKEIKQLLVSIMKGKVNKAIKLIKGVHTPIDEIINEIIDFITINDNGFKFISKFDNKLIIAFLDLLLDFKSELNYIDNVMVDLQARLLQFKLQYVKSISLNFKQAINKLKNKLNPDTVYNQDDFYVFVRNGERLYIVKDEKSVLKGKYLLFPSDVIKVLKGKSLKGLIKYKTKRG